MKILVVVDMQNDFITGSLGTKEAQAIVPFVKEKINQFKGRIIFTRDTHQKNYLSTLEGKNLPIPHCIENTQGWEIENSLKLLQKEETLNKPTFASTQLIELLHQQQTLEPIESITIIGLCTDICVISNALLIKAFFPEISIVVDAACCAGVTPQSHLTALNAMKPCQIEIINE